MKIYKIAHHYDYQEKCQECGKMCNHDEIEKIMGTKVCKDCSKLIGENIAKGTKKDGGVKYFPPSV